MLSITIQDLLQGRADHQAQDHFLYSIRDKETLFYIGQTKNDPKERLYTHIYNPGKRPKQSNVGVFIIQNLPTSLNWMIDLYTLKDCEPILIEKNDTGAVVMGLYKANEIAGDYIQSLIDTLPDMCANFPAEEQAIKKDLLSILDALFVCSEKEFLNIWETSCEKLANIRKKFVLPQEEKYPLEKVLERYYDHNYSKRAMETVEGLLIVWGCPCLNIRGNVWPQAIPDKYVITGLSSEILQRNSDERKQINPDLLPQEFRMTYHFLIH